MSDQPDLTTSDLLSSLQDVQSYTQTLDAELKRLDQALRRFNVRTSDKLSEAVWNIDTGISRAVHQGQEVLTRLEQLQDLVRTSALISTSLELDNVLQRVLDTVISLTEAERAFLVLRDSVTGELSIQAARNWDHHTLNEGDVMFSRSIVQTAFENREPIVTTNAQQDERFLNAVSVMQQGLRAVLCIPLTVQMHVVGVLYCDNRISQGAFSANSIPLLAAFGTQAAIAIEKARLHEEALARQKLEEELLLSQRIQRSMLPRTTPSIDQWRFAAEYQSARQVGGDFYDFFRLPGDPNTLCIVIADVSDKGVPAALFMAQCRTMIRTTTTNFGSPALILHKANALIQQDGESDMFLTCFYAMLDTLTGQLTFANAGHNYPLWWHEGELHELHARGMLLGMIEDITLTEATIQIDRGDLILFYTDGVTEAMNEHEELFGEERLRELLGAHLHDTVEEIQAAITNALAEFVGDAPRSDDVTFVVLQRC
ncbi:MAG: SpoIIE family protein phosphatase [Anaerolineae bacterium]|nr:SpoIIE family protein phosphatase [Anaerolineae bacterium]